MPILWGCDIFISSIFELCWIFDQMNIGSAWHNKLAFVILLNLNLRPLKSWSVHLAPLISPRGNTFARPRTLQYYTEWISWSGLAEQREHIRYLLLRPWSVIDGCEGTVVILYYCAVIMMTNSRFCFSRRLADWQSAQREAVVHFSSSVAAHPPAGPMPSHSVPQSNPPGGIAGNNHGNLVLHSQAAVVTNTSLARASVAVRNRVAAVDLKPFKPLLDTVCHVYFCSI